MNTEQNELKGINDIFGPLFPGLRTVIKETYTVSLKESNHKFNEYKKSPPDLDYENPKERAIQNLSKLIYIIENLIEEESNDLLTDRFNMITEDIKQHIFVINNWKERFENPTMSTISEVDDLDF